MEFSTFIILVVIVAVNVIAITWVVLYIQHLRSTGYNIDPEGMAQDEANKIFTDEFREELRNRGQLKLEKAINENAMFLKEDLQFTTTQLNEHMKQALTKALKEEFRAYREAIDDAKTNALDSIKKTHQSMEELRNTLEDELRSEVAKEKQARIERFESSMAAVLNKYIIETIGSEIDLTQQSDYIFNRLEEQKDEIKEDIKNAG